MRECCLFYLDALDSMASGRARFLEAGGSIVVAGVYCTRRSVEANTIAVKVIEDVLS